MTVTTAALMGTAAALWAVLVLVLCIAAHRGTGQTNRWKPWYRAVLFIGALAVAANGFLGGAMIYGLDHYAW